jgi:hypothetical protein
VNIAARDVINVQAFDMATLRSALRAAILAWNDATVTEESAARTVGKSQQLTDESDSRLSNDVNLDDEIARHKRDGIKAFALGGERPDETLPPALRRRLEVRSRELDLNTGLRASHVELNAEFQAAAKAREGKQAGVYDAASAVIAAEAERIAVRRQVAQAEVWACDEELAAAAANWVRGVDRPRPVRLTPRTLAIMNAGNVPVMLAPPVASKKKQDINARWRSYFERLCVDADARLE